MNTDLVGRDDTPSLVTMDSVERRVIVYLRLLRSLPAGRAEIEQDLAARTGGDIDGSLDQLARIEALIAGAVDRPLDIGTLDTTRATPDERAVASLIAAAAAGDVEACRRLAGRLVREPDHAPLVEAARHVASAIAAGDAPRCSCGRTADDLGACHIR